MQPTFPSYVSSSRAHLARAEQDFLPCNFPVSRASHLISGQQASPLPATFVCMYVQVSVFGFGADSNGKWHHYWEENRFSGAFRRTGVHDADFELSLIKKLVAEGQISLYN